MVAKLGGASPRPKKDGGEFFGHGPRKGTAGAKGGKPITPSNGRLQDKESLLYARSRSLGRKRSQQPDVADWGVTPPRNASRVAGSPTSALAGRPMKPNRATQPQQQQPPEPAPVRTTDPGVGLAMMSPSQRLRSFEKRTTAVTLDRSPSPTTTRPNLMPPTGPSLSRRRSRSADKNLILRKQSEPSDSEDTTGNKAEESLYDPTAPKLTRPSSDVSLFKHTKKEGAKKVKRRQQKKERTRKSKKTSRAEQREPESSAVPEEDSWDALHMESTEGRDTGLDPVEQFRDDDDGDEEATIKSVTNWGISEMVSDLSCSTGGQLSTLVRTPGGNSRSSGRSLNAATKKLQQALADAKNQIYPKNFGASFFTVKSSFEEPSKSTGYNGPHSTSTAGDGGDRYTTMDDTSDAFARAARTRLNAPDSAAGSSTDATQAIANGRVNSSSRQRSRSKTPDPKNASSRSKNPDGMKKQQQLQPGRSRSELKSPTESRRNRSRSAGGSTPRNETRQARPRSRTPDVAKTQRPRSKTPQGLKGNSRAEQPTKSSVRDRLGLNPSKQAATAPKSQTASKPNTSTLDGLLAASSDTSNDVVSKKKGNPLISSLLNRRSRSKSPSRDRELANSKAKDSAPKEERLPLSSLLRRGRSRSKSPSRDRQLKESQSLASSESRQGLATSSSGSTHSRLLISKRRPTPSQNLGPLQVADKVEEQLDVIHQKREATPTSSGNQNDQGTNRAQGKKPKAKGNRLFGALAGGRDKKMPKVDDSAKTENDLVMDMLRGHAGGNKAVGPAGVRTVSNGSGSKTGDSVTRGRSKSPLPLSSRWFGRRREDVPARSTFEVHNSSVSSARSGAGGSTRSGNRFFKRRQSADLSSTGGSSIPAISTGSRGSDMLSDRLLRHMTTFDSLVKATEVDNKFSPEAQFAVVELGDEDNAIQTHAVLVNRDDVEGHLRTPEDTVEPDAHLSNSQRLFGMTPIVDHRNAAGGSTVSSYSIDKKPCRDDFELDRLAVSGSFSNQLQNLKHLRRPPEKVPRGAYLI